MKKHLNQFISKLLLIKSFKDVYWVVQGNINLWLFNFKLLPKHMDEQILMRLNVCKPCVMNGECLICGCYTTQKICSNKPDKNYLRFMNRMNWEQYKIYKNGKAND